MNFVFISPHFPKSYWNFCDRLKRNGVNVLGIGDAPYDSIPDELKSALTEYYKVNDLGNHDEMVRAVGYFTFRYGKIDWLESNNEYWLEMDAQLRTDFNITTGAQNDFIQRIKFKSQMKESYRRAGVPVQDYANRSDLPGGSTLGAIANTHFSVLTADVGLAQLAMHSACETAGAEDTDHLIRCAAAFYGACLRLRPDGGYDLA